VTGERGVRREGTLKGIRSGKRRSVRGEVGRNDGERGEDGEGEWKKVVGGAEAEDRVEV